MDIDSQISTKVILESISDGVFTIDKDWKITFFNSAAEKITGVKRGDAMGRLCSEVFRSTRCETGCILNRAILQQTTVSNELCYIIRADGKQIPISISAAVLRNEYGTVIGGVETFRDLSEIETLRKELKGRFVLGDLISHSASMQKVFDLVPVVSSLPSTILIHGETGTGKELLARAIHASGNRAKGPFIAINCGALPDNLLESELFGYKRGAFTGATQDKNGRFSLAKNGTIFLDEIGDITPALQLRLLRVLQERCFEPLGSMRPEKMEARVIAATHRDLAALVKLGQFREDLYYRINVIRIDLPPLRQRKEDIPLLVEHFIKKFNTLHGRNIEGILPDALSILMSYDWPGNIRELENLVERVFVMCSEKWINSAHIPLETQFLPQICSKKIKSAKNLTESQVISSALKHNKFNHAATAKELGIHKTTLYRKIKSLSINTRELRE